MRTFVRRWRLAEEKKRVGGKSEKEERGMKGAAVGLREEVGEGAS